MERAKKILTDEEAKARLEALCVRAERCVFELQQKLRGWGITGQRAQDILDSLIDRRFVDDVRFAHAFVNDKVRFQRRGRLIIKRDLMLKRIKSDIIDEVLSEIDEDLYRANLEYTLRAKMRGLSDEVLADPLTRQKLLRHAVSRGYELSLAATTLRALLNE